jgi:hypothetical protein
MGFQLKSKFQRTWMWWPSCRLCYHPTIFFWRLLLTAVWFQKEKFWLSFLSDFPSSTKLLMLGCACNVDELQASPWLRVLFPSLLPRDPGFNPGSIRVWFVVGRVAGDQVLLPVMRLSPVSSAPPLLRCNIHLCTLPIRRANFRNYRVPYCYSRYQGSLQREVHQIWQASKCHKSPIKITKEWKHQNKIWKKSKRRQE